MCTYLNMARFVVFDLETTGLNVRDDRIVSLAALDMHTGREFFAHVNPGVPVPRAAQEVHGLTDDFLRAKPKWASVGRRFWAWFARLYEEPGARVCLVGHNAARFDAPFLQNELARLGMKGAKPLRAYVVDTLPVFRAVFTEVKSKSQASVYEHLFGAPPKKQHDARGDVRALARIIKTDDVRARLETPAVAFKNSVQLRVH